MNRFVSERESNECSLREGKRGGEPTLDGISSSENLNGLCRSSPGTSHDRIRRIEVKRDVFIISNTTSRQASEVGHKIELIENTDDIFIVGRARKDGREDSQLSSGTDEIRIVDVRTSLTVHADARVTNTDLCSGNTTDNKIRNRRHEIGAQHRTNGSNVGARAQLCHIERECHVRRTITNHVTARAVCRVDQQRNGLFQS